MDGHGRLVWVGGAGLFPTQKFNDGMSAVTWKVGSQTMRHEQVQENMSAYIEGDLDVAMKTAVDNHLRECSECSDELAMLKSVYAALDSGTLEVEPPGQFHDNVMRRIRVGQQSQPKQGILARLGWGWSLGALAGAAALAFVVVPQLRSGADSNAEAGYSLNTGTAVVRSIVVATTGDAEAGRDFNLTVGIMAPSAGSWQLTAQPSRGLAVGNAASTGAGPVRIFEAELAQDKEKDVPLTLHPSRTGLVTETTLTLRSTAGEQSVTSTVFVPIHTGGDAGRVMNIMPLPSGTVQSVLEDIANVYGVTVNAPADVLAHGFTTPIANASVDAAIAQVAQAAGLKVQKQGDAYNLIH